MRLSKGAAAAILAVAVIPALMLYMLLSWNDWYEGEER